MQLWVAFWMWYHLPVRIYEGHDEESKFCRCSVLSYAWSCDGCTGRRHNNIQPDELDGAGDQQVVVQLFARRIDLLDPVLNLEWDDRNSQNHVSPWCWCWAADDCEVWLFQRRYDLFMPVDCQRNEEQR